MDDNAPSDLMIYLLSKYLEPDMRDGKSQWDRDVADAFTDTGQTLARMTLLNFVRFARELMQKRPLTQLTYYQDVPALVLNNHEMVTWPVDESSIVAQDDTTIQINVVGGPRRSIDAGALQINSTSKGAAMTGKLEELANKMLPR